MVDYIVNSDGYLEYLHNPTNSKMPVVAPIEITGGYLTRLIDDQEAILQNLLTEVLNLKALEGNTKNVQLISAQATTLNSLLTQLQGLRSDVQANNSGSVTVDLTSLEALVGAILNDELPLLRQLNTDIKNKIPSGDFPVALNLAQKSLLDNIITLLTSIQTSNVDLGLNSDDILLALDEANTWAQSSNTKLTSIDTNLQGIANNDFPSLLSKLDTLVTNTELLLGNGMVNIEQTILETIATIASNLVYVSPMGDDNNTGVELSPFRTIGRALTELQGISGAKGIKLLPGKYTETCPLVVPRDVAIIGDNPQQVIVEPTTGTKNNHIMLVDSGVLISNVTFSGHNSGKFAIALNSSANNVSIGATNTGAYILKVPCVHNCQVVTSPNGSVIEGAIVDSGSAGGAIEIDGNKCASNSPSRSVAVYNLKVIALNGEGCLVKNDGQIHLYNCESNFAQYHVKAISGGLALLQESKAHFGVKGLIADGVSPTPLFTGLVTGSINENTVQVASLSTSRIGSPKPYGGMLLQLGGTIYRIISSQAVTGGFSLTLESPLLASHSMSSASFLRASTIISNSQFFHYVGAGYDYRALPENGGEAIAENEKEELNNGRIVCNSFNSEGDVNINDKILVNGMTGEVTIGEITVNFPPEVEGLTLYRYNSSEQKFSYNDSSTALDGWSNLALSINPHDMTEHDFRLLSEKISAGGIYQLYVDIDNPSASDAKSNRGNSPLRPFRTLERALLEAARRSFSKGNDIYNRVSIHVAPGIYDLNNGVGGSTDATYYHRFQDAATLVLKNRDSIVDLAYAQFNFVTQDSLELRRRLKEEILYAVNAITEDLSAMGNRAVTNLGRSYVGNRNLNPGDAGFTLANFLDTFYYGLYLDTYEPQRSNSLISSLINALFLVRDEAIKAMRNQGIVTDSTIIVDDETPACANVASAISTLIDILTKTLVGEINPYAININMGTALNIFIENGEPNALALQSFNDPINAGIILPRGVSIIGADLRKVIFRPKYVPAPFDNNVAPSSIFRMTGGNFFQGFTILDQHGKYRDGAPAFSHHKLSGFAFCKNQDLELYYNNVLVAFADRSIYNRSQDAANLLERNVEWVMGRTIPTVYPVQYERYIAIFSRELKHFLFSLVTDLRRLDKHNINAFAERFRSAHITSLEPQSRNNAATYYESLFRGTFDSVVDAINNQANRIEGGITDDRIIIDDTSELRCADVVSAIINYYDILSASIKSQPSVNLINDKFAIEDSEARDLETSIVIPSNSGNMDSVEGASPYIFSASVRSEYGMCGIDGNGNDVGGLKSYLAAQFTIISLQRDTAVFTVNQAQGEVPGYRYKGSLATDYTLNYPDCRHYGYRVRNGAYAQLVSCFCICPAVHYWADNGSEFSITNSTSNFGDISLYSEGFLGYAYPQDQGALLAGIIKPQDLPHIRVPNPDFADRFTLGTIASIFDLGSNLIRITLSGAAKFLDRYEIDNPDKLSYVYVSSRTINERRATVQSVSLNSENKTEIIVNIAGSPGTWVWLPEDEEDVDATVIGRQLYIKRFVDTRKTIDKQYRLIIKRVPPLTGKRKPPIHYIIQRQVAQGVAQPFALEPNETRGCFYILDVEDTELLQGTGQQCYATRIAAVNRDTLGNIEYEIDLDVSAKINLDYDPSDPSLIGALDKADNASRLNIASFLTALGINVNLNVSSSTVIDLTSRNVSLNFHKPSIIRCGGQTWEYMGYYNYSTAIPSEQEKKLGEHLSNDILKKALRLSKTQTPLFGGRIYATGMDEEGNTYAGNSIIDLKSGGQEEIIRGTSPEVIAEIEEEEIVLNVTYDTVIIKEGLYIEGEIGGLPLASEDKEGIARIATDAEVVAEQDNETIVTPAKLKKWRIANKIVSGKTTSNNIYVSNRAAGYHSAAEPYRNASNPNQGDAVTFSQFNANQNDPNNEGRFWQLSNPAAPNFRCLSGMDQVAAYGNANLSTNDQLRLFMDPGKYRADYTYNFGLIINGANNRGAAGWGNPDGSDIAEDGSTGGVILYVTCGVADGGTGDTIGINPSAINITSTATTNLQFVHFWTHVTACKDPDTEWSIKAKGENTFEQMILRANDVYWAANNSTDRVSVRSQYNGTWAGYNRSLRLIVFRESGFKDISYCTFSGNGCSVSAMDRGGPYAGGYIYIVDSCNFQLRNIVLRGNEEIRFSDKHGRFVTTAVNNTPVLVPPEGYRTPDKWTWASIYDSNGNIITSNIYGAHHTSGFFHDPFTEEWVSVGFCDFFIGVGENARVNLTMQGNGFSGGLSYFGYNELVPYGSTDGRMDGVFTINNDIHNIRLERNTGKLFGTEDDRLVSKETSENSPGSQLVYFKGTDNLGRKIKELHPPTLQFTNGQVNNSQRTAWTNWVNNLINQGPIIVMFMRNRYPYQLSIWREYSIWSDRDSSGLIRGQGFLGEFGYIPRIENRKLTGIRSWDFSEVSYGRTISWSSNGVGCKILCGNQYHYNLFRPAWKGFRLGRYQHPVIIDIGAAYTTLMDDLVANNNDYSILADYIEDDTITKNSQSIQLHTLDGQIVGAMFYLVGTSASQVLSVMYTGYEYEADGLTKKHKFILINRNIGVVEYLTIKSQNYIFDTIEQMLGANLSVVAGTKVFIKESNLILIRTVVNGTDNGSDSLKSWTPQPLSPSYEVMHNLANMGLLGNIYKRGFFADHFGYECNTQTDFNSSSSLPDNPELRAGFYAKDKFLGLEVMITTNGDIIL